MHIDQSLSFQFEIATLRRLERSPLDLPHPHSHRRPRRLPRIPQNPTPHRVRLFSSIALDLAAIPREGNHTLALTYNKDVGEFVSLVMDLPEWERRYYRYADHLTLEDIIKVIEEVKGVKVDVTYDSRDSLNRAESRLLPRSTESDFKDSKFDRRVLFKAYLARLGSCR